MLSEGIMCMVAETDRAVSPSGGAKVIRRVSGLAEETDPSLAADR